MYDVPVKYELLDDPNSITETKPGMVQHVAIWQWLMGPGVQHMPSITWATLGIKPYHQ